MASGAKFPEIPFSQEPDHPMVGVSWNDSIEFCVWLTGKERSEGKIDENIVYRLPTDLEWSASVGLPHEPESTPAERHLKAPGYPWGLRWPPPQNAGNYEHRREDQLELVVRAEYSEEIVRDNSSESHFSDVGEYCRSHSEVADQIRKNLARWQAEWVPIDEYKFTSPVGTFAENPFGVQDSGGNVWEWCMDDIVHKDERAKVARGASFSLCPLNGISVEREVVFGTVVYRQTSSREWGLLTIKNADAYKSSYRHYGNGEKPLSSSEFGTLVPGQWGNVPCGGFRAVLVAC